MSRHRAVPQQRPGCAPSRRGRFFSTVHKDRLQARSSRVGTLQASQGKLKIGQTVWGSTGGDARRPSGPEMFEKKALQEGTQAMGQILDMRGKRCGRKKSLDGGARKSETVFDKGYFFEPTSSQTGVPAS